MWVGITILLLNYLCDLGKVNLSTFKFSICKLLPG